MTKATKHKPTVGLCAKAALLLTVLLTLPVRLLGADELPTQYTAPVMLKGGWGQTYLEIAVDTLRYHRKNTDGSVSVDVHADFQLPFAVSDEVTKVGFVGKNIVLSGEKGTSDIMLDTHGKEYEKYPILEKRAWLVLNKESHVTIDCNGFKEMRLVGEFEFDSKTIFPADTTKGDSTMRAAFDITVADLEDIVIETGFKRPFKVKGTGDITYTVTGVVADMSTVRNADGFAFPKGYVQPFEKEDASYWTGFALKTIKVDLKDEIPFLDSLSAYNMLIDETGFSGWFSAGFSYSNSKEKPAGVDQVIDVSPDKKEEGQGDSFIDAKLHKIAVGIIANKVVGGELDGTLKVMGLKTDNSEPLTIGLTGKMYTDEKSNLSYKFQSKIKKDITYQLPVCDKATITIGEGTSVTYEKKISPDSTHYIKGFYFNLCGGADFKSSLVELEGLKFQNVQFSTVKPYFGGGTFSLTSLKPMSLAGLSFGLTELTASYDTASMVAQLRAGVMLQLISDGNGAGVKAKFQLLSDVKNDWKVMGLRVDSIAVNIDFSAFHLNGAIGIYKDDKVFGNGFDGNLTLSIDAININVAAAAKFGRTSYNSKNDKSYRYWYAYAKVGLPSGVVIFPPAVMLQSVSLAVYSKMAFQKGASYELSNNYTPDKNTAFGFMGGIGICLPTDNLISAKVSLGMEFSSSGGIKFIQLDGAVYMLASNQENSMINGTLNCYYDFENDILHMATKVEADLKKVITGKAFMNLHSDPDQWYFNLGTVDNPSNLKFAGIARAKSYFMMGDNVPAFLPPLDKKITEKFKVVQSEASANDNSKKFSSGSGFAFGLAMEVDCGLNKFIYANVTLMGGTDALVVRLPSEICGNTKYRGKGRAYVYLDMQAGVKVRRKKFCVMGVSALSALEAEFPKPYYVEGKVCFTYRVLGGLIKGNANTKFKAGSRCNEYNGMSNYEVTEAQFDFSEYEDEWNAAESLLENATDEELGNQELGESNK